MLARIRASRCGGESSASGAAAGAWWAATMSSHSGSATNKRTSSAWLSSGWRRICARWALLGGSRCSANWSCSCVMAIFMVKAAHTSAWRSLSGKASAWDRTWHSVAETRACEAL
ncbi:hypothetical protein D3C80_1741360 [compost metagenome]